MKKPDLKPCPFCGDHLVKFVTWPKSPTICEVFCMNCHANTGAKFTKKEAIKHWNSRVNKNNSED